MSALAAYLFLLIPPPNAKLEIPVPPPVPAIKEGYYEATGDINGKEYTSLVLIAKAGKNYAVVWINGAEQQSGIGVLDGERLLVGFASDNGVRGLARFTITENTLTGTWQVLPGDGKSNKETLTFLKGFKSSK